MGTGASCLRGQTDMTKTTINAAIAVLLAFMLTACATRLGRSFDEGYAQQIKAGETTKTEVLGKLGKPVLRKGGKEEEIWTDAYYTGPTRPSWFY